MTPALPGQEASDQPRSLQQESPEEVTGKRVHGRIPADHYKTSTTVVCEHAQLHPGDQCPREGCKGRLYDTDEPQVLIRLEGRPLMDATRYEQQVLRCHAARAGLPPACPPECRPRSMIRQPTPA